MEQLTNPERHWDQPDETRHIDRDQIADRIGPFEEDYEVVGGGLANLNVRIGQEKLLRIYCREIGARAKEGRLLNREWTALRTPAVLGQGRDFLVMEYVEHEPVVATPEHGEAFGHALAEIHQQTYESCGFLDNDTSNVEKPFDDFFGTIRQHMRSYSTISAELLDAASACYDERRQVIEDLAKSPVLLHGDFKVSNLHWTSQNQPLVLDWEFAWAGPSLMDVGQLMRWDPPRPFCDAFARAYERAGNPLPPDWRELANVLDLVNLVGLMEDANPASRRFHDLRQRIRRTAHK